MYSNRGHVEMWDEDLQPSPRYLVNGCRESEDIQRCKYFLLYCLHVQYPLIYIQYCLAIKRTAQAGGGPASSFGTGGKVGSTLIIRSGGGG